MASQYRHRRTSSPSTAFPATLEPGEIAVNTANRQLALGDADGASVGAPLPLLTIRYFDVRAQYVTNDYVMQNGIVYRANAAVPPGAFNASNWTVIANPGTFVLKAGDTMTGHLALPTNPAAANAVRKDYVDAADTALGTAKVAKAGDTMSGFLTLHADPDAPLKAATKQYVDSKPSLVVSDAPPATPLDNLLWWDSDTGTLYVRYNDGAGTPQWVQAVAMPAIDTAAFVLKSGDTMTGTLVAAADVIAKSAADPTKGAIYFGNSGSRFLYYDGTQYALPVAPTLIAAPTAASHAATKQYVDDKRQRISLAGGRSFDVQVPAGAQSARLTGVVYPSSGTGLAVGLQLSVAAGVFKSGATDYTIWGFYHQTMTAPTTVTAVSNSPSSQINLATLHANPSYPATFDGTVQLKRPSAGFNFVADFRGYVATSDVVTNTYRSVLTAAAAGSALNILALRILATGGDNWAAESYLNVEWM